ncbi:3-phenylpropionate/trans-cinnamate dioxygenase ferredoxin subunit [Candidatus Kryptobacter tengchongensis]|uniref:3-phenylpropionate/trans-cinnamate dioxygenase ferredoxin subunit n=1 Tax=Kryptobacter tengchongensis TaxID=1643429 RepID=A0A916LK83_KRYT1|nr:Rieske (2Fe-2S) protein [Candidatus Kryptobacter tengchongensis]CUT03621.1 3-phenylpropionate/trans-cinnamate dioxygenase ferredoxin subunit [Candidatus Kryptobacter tengchongensis]CUU07819.1 3-phenylpropionate/trans-cinnamate dioxygenase ferredoxin subunit [Candidatus Kryptobacter tengchongensis]
MAREIKLCKISDIRSGKARSFKIDDLEIAVINLNSKFFALSNICPHQHTKVVNGSEAIVEGENIICPMHGWTFEIKTGKAIHGSGRLETFEVFLKNDEIWIKIEDEQT